MIIFALDTTSEYGSAGIFDNDECLASATTGDYVSVSKHPSEPLDYSVVLFQMANRLLEQTGLNFEKIQLFAVASGPGSFTGIRVGVAAIQAWGQVFGRPVFGVSVLEAMAEESQRETGWIVPLMDARRGEFFVAAFPASPQNVRPKPRKRDAEDRIARDCTTEPAHEIKDRDARSQLHIFSLNLPVTGAQASGSNLREGVILNTAEVEEFIARLNSSGEVTCISREHDSHAQALRERLVCRGATGFETESAGRNKDRMSVNEQELPHGNVDVGVRWQAVREILVHAIARLALRAAEEGRLQTPSELDAFYIRRPDAELRFKGD